MLVTFSNNSLKMPLVRWICSRFKAMGLITNLEKIYITSNKTLLAAPKFWKFRENNIIIILFKGSEVIETAHVV